MIDIKCIPLPKWPQMIVTGKKIHEDQALEIIRRTDAFFDFFQCGNNHDFIDEVKRILRFPPDPYDVKISYEEGANRFSLIEKRLEDWGVVKTQYVENNWISCSFIGGPHGWCHPDGKIGYADNVGKWPAAEEVYDDWAKIAEAFPFLEIEATLMSGESGEDDTYPVVSFLVRNGKVEVVDPAERNIHAENMRTMPNETNFTEHLTKILMSRQYSRSSENAIPIEQIQKWADEFFESKEK